MVVLKSGILTIFAPCGHAFDESEFDAIRF